MSTVREHLGLLWLLRRQLVATNPQYDQHWAMQASQFVGVHLDELIALAGGADIEDWARKHFPEIPADFPANRPTATSAAVSADATLHRIADVFGIGSGARTPDTILANIENAARRSQCLRAIEREFFTVTTQDDDGEEYDECLLNWGADPAEYVEQFRAAIATQSKEPKGASE